MMTNELMHEGVLRKSGRYPWGSGETPYQRNMGFLQYVDKLHKQGLSDVQIVEGLDLESTTELRAVKSIAKNQVRAEDTATAQKYRDKGMSNVAIGERMGINESSVRALLNPALKARNDELVTTANMLRDQVKAQGYLDIGAGTENHIGISNNKLSTAVAMLKEEGYKVDYVKVEQLGTGNFTTVKVLSPPGTTYSDLYKNQDKIGTVATFTEDGGKSFRPFAKPTDVDSKRVSVVYGPDGGADKDGLIELRRGKDDISLGGAKYAQVRVSVDGTHYLKGMAVYADDLPAGVDVRFNTNKENTGNKLDAMKAQKVDKSTGGIDKDGPFGSTVKQKYYFDKDGKEKLSALNIVNEEGDWHKWSQKLSSQMLSKQTPELIKSQLDLAHDIKKSEFDEIMQLTNPAVKRKLLESFSDGADSSAVHLKAAGLPRTRNHVIIPIPDLKSTEIYAPNYKDGEKVVLIRHPHGGKFEIPELTVNNKNKSAKGLLAGAIDAVGISPKTATQLSGADFDGDTVLVIPNNSKKVKTMAPLEGLKDFEPQKRYPGFPGMKKMGEKGGGNTQTEMGNISNLITDMTIKGANTSEIARAVRHSMVVIDAEKHGLNYRQSAKDNMITQLKTQYQGGPTKGASTLISRASSDERVDKRKPRSVKNGGPIDALTGKKMYEPTGESYTKTVIKKGVSTEETVFKMDKVKRMELHDDAHALVSSNGGTPREKLYADYANRMKAMGNQARKEMLATKSIPYSPSAKVVFDPQVKSLNAKLNIALKNKPLERQAQLLANTMVAAKKQARPEMDADELKKVKGQALTAARGRTGAGKQHINITPDEWTAIQSGAISNNKLNQILNNSDLDKVKALATPRVKATITDPQMARAKAMLRAGHTQAEIAEALGVPTSTLNDHLSGKVE